MRGLTGNDTTCPVSLLLIVLVSYVTMNRNTMIQQLESRRSWDLCIIGGGATGLATALDASSRGLKTILLEQSDFVKGTSSRSTKLVHGGVRYLRQGNIKLVKEALRERGLLIRNAPHVVQNRSFIIPLYKWWEKPFYGIGLRIYDQLAGKLSLGRSRTLTPDETIDLAPALVRKGLRGSVLYYDGQFDDARLGISIAKTAALHGGILLNYFHVNGLLKNDGKVCGVAATDSTTGKTYEVFSRAVINATGVYADKIMKMDEAGHRALITPSQGIHVVVDKEFLPGNAAPLVPRTSDGRVLFADPWQDKVIIGTTDTLVERILPEPVPVQEEIDFILHEIARYLDQPPCVKDVKSIFAGLRPLVKGNRKKTSALSRDFLISTSDSGLISIIGGKWTTCRHMAEKVMDLTTGRLNMTAEKCITRALRLSEPGDLFIPVSLDSIDQDRLTMLVKYGIEHEMCVTVEDFLSRRTRQLILDARKALELAPHVATIMQKMLNRDEEWKITQLHNFNLLVANYLPKP